jgi:hypothetical protein
MRRAHRVRNRDRQPEQPVERHPSLHDQIAQRLPLHALHRQEQPTVRLLHRINGDVFG